MEISKLLDKSAPLLTAADEHELAKAIEAGLCAGEALAEGTREASADGVCEAYEGGARSCDATNAELQALVAAGERARERFLLANLRLVAMVARREASRSGLSLDDLFSEGFLGLVQALERFDYRQPVRFATYAYPWIRAKVDQASLARCGGAHAGAAHAGQRRKLKAVERRLGQSLGRQPSAAEVAAEVCRPVSWVETLLAYSEPSPLQDREGRVIELRDYRAERDFRAVESPMPQSLARLDPQARRVVELRFGLDGGPDRAYAEVARILHLTPSRVRRIEERALARLRESWADELPLSG